MGEEERVIGFKDWDDVITACEKEFEKIDNTRVTMGVAEQCQKTVYKMALKERSKYPEPKPQTMEETETPEEPEESKKD